MNNRLLFCIESNHQAETDYQYIRETILYFYINDSKTSYRPLFMKTKTRYKSPATIKAINAFCNHSEKAKTHVIYFIDVDNCNASPEDKKLLNDIQEFCTSNDFELVLFCRDIEDVYWGKQISDSEKVKMAESFKKQKKISSVSESNLRKDGYSLHSSNILTILDQYFLKNL